VTATVRPARAIGDDHADLVAALEPVRRALLDDAGAEADRLVEEATAEAEAQVRAAETRAERAVEQARERARATAAARARRAVGAARREAHAVQLQAESRIWADVVERLHRAVDTMPSDPRYPALLDRLEQVARRRLGEEATIERDPEGGGILADQDGRRLDYRLRALADRALEALAEEVAELWS
jgi:vacuolar-type H+-ATPase subunit E/Vma4